MMRVCIAPSYHGDDRGDGGIRRVVEAQVAHLPAFGWDVTNSPDEADLIACHGATLVERPGVPLVSHNHGLYWEDYQFGAWGDVTNAHVIEAMVRAQAITAPSRWVAHAITRGMLANPTVIHHGVDADAWAHDGQHGGYVLWNKARVDPVSDPRDMQQLAARLPDVPFVSTFGQPAANVTITGPGTYDQMRPLVQRAALYLATARETFGIGTLEALAAGVPVVGWDYGGQHEIVIPGETGILVPFGDMGALADAVRRALSDRVRLSANARQDARERRAWPDKIAQYAALYTRVLEDWRRPRPRVSVIVTAYNLGRYVMDTLASVEQQTMTDFECVIVDDCSTDETPQIVTGWTRTDPRFHYRKTPQNLGLAGARNFGVQHATGTYILFLDADDLLAPNALDTLAHALDADPGIHVAYGSLDTMDQDGGNRKRNPWPAGQFSWHAQIAHLNQIHGACLMRREVLARSGGYRRRDWRAEDAAFWSRVTSFGFRAAKVTEDTIQIYRMHAGQKSRTEDGDGDWTAWLPWRLAHDAHSGMQAMRQHAQPNARIVPFGAQGEPPAPLKAWPVRHHQHPVVSVIIPVGPGHAETLIDALDSVQAQTLPEWECIVVDDTDDPLDLTAYPWARVVTAAGTTGAGAARNLGFQHARAPLVLFLDADDILAPRTLELLVKGYADSGRYAYSDWITLEDERRVDGGMTPHEVEAYDQHAMLHGLRHAVSALIPADWVRAIGGFDERLPVFEDWDLFGRMAAAGLCGVRVPHPLLIYRLGAGQRTRAALQSRATGGPLVYTDLGARAAAAIADRFAPYVSGEESVMGCCSGSAPVVAQANAALNDMVQFATGGAFAPANAPNAPSSVQTVRMEFIGGQFGAQTFYGKVSQRPYRAGREPGARYHDVDPRDVDYFAALGLFRVVGSEAIANGVEEHTPQPAEPRAVKGRQG